MEIHPIAPFLLDAAVYILCLVVGLFPKQIEASYFKLIHMLQCIGVVLCSLLTDKFLTMELYCTMYDVKCVIMYHFCPVLITN